MGKHKLNIDRLAEWHWRLFDDFCRFELMAGGPDPHMKAVAYLSEDQPLVEKLWRTMAYISVYNVPAAEAIWTAWPWDRVRLDPTALGQWVLQNWPNLPMRKERRPIRSPRKLAKFLAHDAVAFVDGALATHAQVGHLRRGYYGEYGLYEYVTSVPSLGRYSGMKVAETLHVMGLSDDSVPDMNPRGAWSPRLGLSLLYPQHAGTLNANDDSTEALDLCNSLFDEVRTWFHTHGLKLSAFTTEVLLCDYKQAVNGRQYPGRSQDSELEYMRKVGPLLPVSEYMTVARPRLVPRWARGEVQGWTGVRKELGTTIPEHEYAWSDRLFSYSLTTDLAHPVRSP